MRLEKLKFSGLFSYGEETKMDLVEDMTLIVGRNNAGKSNIFRIIELLMQSLSSDQRRYLKSNEVFGNKGPEIEAHMLLSKDETELLMDFLSFYEHTNERNNNMWTHFQFTNRFSLHNYLREIVLRIQWKRRYVEHGWEPAHLEICFPRIDLELSTSDVHSDFHIHSISDSKNAQKRFREFLNTITMDEAIPENQKKLLGTGDEPVKVIAYLPLQQGTWEGDALISLERIISHARNLLPSISGIRLVDVLGIIMANSVYRASGNRIFPAGGLEQVPRLASDGSNLAQFLFGLKVSPALEKRARFSHIQHAFEDVMADSPLTFDVVMDYREDVIEKDVINRPTKVARIPVGVRIVIVDIRGGKQFALDEAGSGLSEIIYLLALSYGLQNSIILLDEPAINLHPPQIKALMQKILVTIDYEELEQDQEKALLREDFDPNQYMVVTHSPELAHLLLFEKNVDILYVRRDSNVRNSILTALDEESKKWLKEKRIQLRNTINARIFFGKTVILVEGESDKEFLIGASNYFAEKDRRYDLDSNDVIVTDVGSKDNFPKYVRLLSSLGVQFGIIGDSDVLTDSRASVKDVFRSFSVLTKAGIEEGSNKVFVVKEGNLENLMEQIDQRIYVKLLEDGKKRYGRKVPKSVIAAEFIKEIASSNPQVLEFMRQILANLMGLYIKHDSSFRGQN